MQGYGRIGGLTMTSLGYCAWPCWAIASPACSTGHAARPVAFVALWSDGQHVDVDLGRHGDRFVERSAVLELLDELLRLRLGRSGQLKAQIDALKA